MTTDVQARRGWLAIPAVGFLVRFAAVFGLLLGVLIAALHAASDPLVDIHAYYDAGARMNAGQPLYDQPATPDQAAFYRYPPLLAILFRPLALLPFPVAATIWMGIVVACFAGTLWRIDLRRPASRYLVAILAFPWGWALVIGQAQVVVTFLLALGMPWAVALATNLKIFPIFVAVWWLGRREWRALGRLALWLAVLGAIQLVLAPADTLAYLSFLSLDQVGHVLSISPYEISPALWAVVLVAGTGIAIWGAPRRWGWAAAVALSIIATPRLLIYQLSTMTAGLRAPDDR